MNRPFLIASLSSVTASNPISTVGTDLASTNGKSVIQSTVTGTGTGVTNIIVEGSLDGIGFVPLVSFSQIASTGSVVTEGAYIDFLWFFIRVRVAQIPSGSTASVYIFREE